MPDPTKDEVVKAIGEAQTEAEARAIEAEAIRDTQKPDDPAEADNPPANP